VNMEFADGVISHLSVNAFNGGGRYIRIFGTRGELYAFESDEEIYVYNFAEGKRYRIPVLAEGETIIGGHLGGDLGIVTDLYDYLTDNYTGNSIADIRVSVANHLIGFAAEESRHSDTVVQMDDYFAKNNFENL